ncbi:hypothetical protein HYT84_01125 [Candidatus Micrarchaeota archaeon]|nr:hypothetical protein [Candidatus Micrarchaeota archaeon]
MVQKKTRVVDKWKGKSWYNVVTPAIFQAKEIAEIVSGDEKNLVNRIVKASLFEVIGGSSQNAVFTMLKFRITDLKGKTANTKLIGYEILPTYLKTIIRRNRSLIQLSVPIVTKEDQKVYIKVICVTGSKVSQNTKKNLRNAVFEETKKGAEGAIYEQLMQDIIYGKFVSRLFNRLKQITPIKRVEIRKTELVELFK